MGSKARNEIEWKSFPSKFEIRWEMGERDRSETEVKAKDLARTEYIFHIALLSTNIKAAKEFFHVTQISHII